MSTTGAEQTWRKGEASAEDTQAEGMSHRRMWLIGGAVAVVALWAVLFFAVGGDFYQTVEEAKAAGSSENLRVGGLVSPGSVLQQGEVVTFSLEGETGDLLDVRYVGAFPERLKAYERVVAMGSLGESNTLEATELLIQCPDKLLPEKITNGIAKGAGLERLLY